MPYMMTYQLQTEFQLDLPLNNNEYEVFSSETEFWINGVFGTELLPVIEVETYVLSV
jgi:hypothetical protein